MKIISFNEQMERQVSCVATIGFFDGVHRGHRFLINKVTETAQQTGMASMVITFDVHPRHVLCPGWHPQLLSTLDEKKELLAQTGVDQLVVLPFNADIAALSARSFMEMLRRQGVRVLVTGYDNHFGKRTVDGTEGFDDYVRYGRELDMTVLACSPFEAGNILVSSSQVRHFLQIGDVESAARCLGRSYTLTGNVVRGEHIGTGLGFPTANLQLPCADKMVPAAGVYAVRACIGSSRELLSGMMNIGRRPTFNGDHLTLEAHVFHFNDNLYGQQMSISFVRRLRSEMKFDSREALAAQLTIDAQLSKEILNQTNDI